LQEVGNNATGSSSTFTKYLAQMKTATDGEVYWAANITPDMCVEFQVWLSNAETEAITCSYC